jgi:hypothetical protein
VFRALVGAWSSPLRAAPLRRPETTHGVWLTLRGQTHVAKPVACAPGLAVLSPGRFEQSFTARTRFHYKAENLSACASFVSRRRAFLAAHTCSEGAQTEHSQLGAPILSELQEPAP